MGQFYLFKNDQFPEVAAEHAADAAGEAARQRAEGRRPDAPRVRALRRTAPVPSAFFSPFLEQSSTNELHVERGPPEVSQNSRVEKLDWSPKSFSFMILTRRRSIPENPRKENKNTHATTKCVSPRIVAIVGCT